MTHVPQCLSCIIDIYLNSKDIFNTFCLFIFRSDTPPITLDIFNISFYYFFVMQHELLYLPKRYDVPPNGSAVVNVALLVNNVKPIGAKAKIHKKINAKDTCFLKVIMQDSLEDQEQSNQANFEFHNLDDFKDYNQPKAACCLVKAVCIYTKLVDLDSSFSLSDQLEKKLNGTLELRTWTG